MVQFTKVDVSRGTTSLVGLKPAPQVTERGTAREGSFEEPSFVMKDADEIV